ncbi:hypothetical protein PRZ48_013143 [Zasmidium cellare]|uniref:Zn(2)-C6 fungal-type domain-containing protein n=1 Tax=Zasmidium cellare TaxID=395010 RepID=A0ABR0E387_ZASCE|nr:hypothetical protein PRZ48_013143 [Zasmidium cellare]
MAQRQRQRRAIVVCSACHKRKIKCDIQPWIHSQALRPCSACLERGTECRLRSRKPYTWKVRSPKKVEAERKTAVVDHVGHHTPVEFHIDQAKVTVTVGSNPVSRTGTLYFGESGYGSLMGILDPPAQSKGRHLSIESSRDNALPAEDLEYLKAKGCFALPDESRALLSAYFKFVHPQFPVLDGTAFLRDHGDGRLDTINLLLLWSMFSVGASYVPACRGAETKALYHMRAKTLFDISGENDKYVLIQSSLLLSFFFDDVEDVQQSWYWSGIAFSLAQSLGLHEILPVVEGKSSPTYRGTLWQCCILRDAWLSYTMGRPLRLWEAELISSSWCQFSDMVLFGERVHIDDEANELEKAWRCSVDASWALNLSLQGKVVQTDSILSRWQSQQQPPRELFNPAVALCSRYSRLCQHAAIIAVCQLNEKNGSTSDASQLDLIDTAEREIASIVQSYLRYDTINCVPLMIVPLIMPALLVAVAALKTEKSTRRERAAERLWSYLALLGAIEHSYPAASMVKRLFGTVRDEILAQNEGQRDTKSQAREGYFRRSPQSGTHLTPIISPISTATKL